MDDISRAALIVRNPEYIWECLRSALGLAVESIETSVYILNAGIDRTDPRLNDFEERLELLDDMEGRVVSNNKANSSEFGFIQFSAMKKIIEELREADLIMPFGG